MPIMTVLESSTRRYPNRRSSRGMVIRRLIAASDCGKMSSPDWTGL